ncbi:hypothetical protein RRG08_046860 [Elysia crispata]|uniref:Transmembrane protein n=1 Tax=Elysia crispata TaxID=231223 RepID=A0AAE1DHL3_9GAST|nr:hypothetical protein RRG08_046860 [Elysia crispata]
MKESLSTVEERMVELTLPRNQTNMTVVSAVMEHSCLQNFNSIACTRSSILASLAILTSLLCVYKLVRLHVAKHPSCHQYVIFYTAGLECATGGMHWIFWNVSQLDFLLQYMKLLQVLIMCHYYITLAIRALRRETLADRFMYPFLCLAVLYFTIVTTMGIFNAESTHVECIAPYWIALSGAEVLVVQLFAISGFYITRRLNEISTLDSVRWTQKRDLWCIVIVFELSAWGTFFYDMILQIKGDRDTGCSAIFSHRQDLYSSFLVSIMVLKLLLPIWVMLFVLQPHVTVIEKEEGLPNFSDDGTYGSFFGEDQTYKHLYQPDDSFVYSSSSTSPDGSPCMYDACLPYTYINTAMKPSGPSGLQTIEEENLEDSPSMVKKTSEARACKGAPSHPDRTGRGMRTQKGKMATTRVVSKDAPRGEKC